MPGSDEEHHDDEDGDCWECQENDLLRWPEEDCHE